MRSEELSGNGTIEVIGSGEVEVAPDQAVISLTVITQAKTAAAAAAQNAKRTQAVLEAVAAEPVVELTITGLGVSPIATYDPETRLSRIIGYRATNGVQVTTKPELAGRIYDVGVEAGANQSSGVSFFIADERPHREAALRLAIEQAYSEAKIVAETAAIGLVGPVSVEVDPGPSKLVPRAAALAPDSPGSPVLLDDISVSASVRLVMRTRI